MGVSSSLLSLSESRFVTWDIRCLPSFPTPSAPAFHSDTVLTIFSFFSSSSRESADIPWRQSSTPSLCKPPSGGEPDEAIIDSESKELEDAALEDALEPDCDLSETSYIMMEIWIIIHVELFTQRTWTISSRLCTDQEASFFLFRTSRRFLIFFMGLRTEVSL